MKTCQNQSVVTSSRIWQGEVLAVLADVTRVQQSVQEVWLKSSINGDATGRSTGDFRVNIRDAFLANNMNHVKMNPRNIQKVKQTPGDAGDSIDTRGVGYCSQFSSRGMWMSEMGMFAEIMKLGK